MTETKIITNNIWQFFEEVMDWAVSLPRHIRMGEYVFLVRGYNPVYVDGVHLPSDFSESNFFDPNGQDSVVSNGYLTIGLEVPSLRMYTKSAPVLTFHFGFDGVYLSNNLSEVLQENEVVSPFVKELREFCLKSTDGMVCGSFSDESIKLCPVSYSKVVVLFDRLIDWRG